MGFGWGAICNSLELLRISCKAMGLRWDSGGVWWVWCGISNGIEVGQFLSIFTLIKGTRGEYLADNPLKKGGGLWLLWRQADQRTQTVSHRR